MLAIQTQNQISAVLWPQACRCRAAFRPPGTCRRVAAGARNASQPSGARPTPQNRRAALLGQPQRLAQLRATLRNRRRRPHRQQPWAKAWAPSTRTCGKNSASRSTARRGQLPGGHEARASQSLWCRGLGLRADSASVSDVFRTSTLGRGRLHDITPPRRRRRGRERVYASLEAVS